MANERDHIVLANGNQKLIDHLIEVNDFQDWLVTVAFFKAVHVVEAVFAQDLRYHSCCHSDRERMLKMHAKYRVIFRDYSHLLNEARNVRYLLAPPQHLTMDAVKSQLIYKRLLGVEQNSLQFLSDDGKSRLVKITPPAKSAAK